MKLWFNLCLGITVLLLMASVAYSAGPPDIVTNGDFSNGLTGWNTLAGNNSAPGSCSAGQVELEAGSFIVADLQQCINITNPPSGTWTFSVADGSTADPTTPIATYRFSTQPNCIGATTGETNSNLRIINTFPGSLGPITHPGDAQSVQINLRVPGDFAFGGTYRACFDNVSFTDSGGSATVVSLQSAEATQAPDSHTSWLIVATILMFVLTILSGRARRKMR